MDSSSRESAQRDAAARALVDNALPRGARDFLPGAFARRNGLEGALLSTFDAWGFRRVATPAIEYDAVIGRGLTADERARCVRFIEAGTGEVVTLRADVTPQIARLVAQRVGGSVEAGEILRLAYAADVVRLPRLDEHAEVHQVGVEHVGDATVGADAELVALAHEALARVGMVGHRFDLTHTDVPRAALAALDLPAPAAERVRGRLARKDRSGLSEILDDFAIDSERAFALASLCDLHGGVSILDEAAKRLAVFEIDSALERLAKIVELVRVDAGEEVADALTIDLGEVRGFDYYTGVRVRVWAPGSSRSVLRGGRYDRLLARYGADLPAIGFAIDVDALELALDHQGVRIGGDDGVVTEVVAVADTSTELRAAAVARAREARARGARAFVIAEVSRADAGRRASECGADRLVYLERRSGRVHESAFERGPTGFHEGTNE